MGGRSGCRGVRMVFASLFFALGLAGAGLAGKPRAEAAPAPTPTPQLGRELGQTMLGDPNYMDGFQEKPAYPFPDADEAERFYRSETWWGLGWADEMIRIGAIDYQTAASYGRLISGGQYSLPDFCSQGRIHSYFLLGMVVICQKFFADYYGLEPVPVNGGKAGYFFRIPSGKQFAITLPDYVPQLMIAEGSVMADRPNEPVWPNWGWGKVVFIGTAEAVVDQGCRRISGSRDARFLHIVETEIAADKMSYQTLYGVYTATVQLASLPPEVQEVIRNGKIVIVEDVWGTLDRESRRINWAYPECAHLVVRGPGLMAKGVASVSLDHFAYSGPFDPRKVYGMGTPSKPMSAAQAAEAHLEEIASGSAPPSPQAGPAPAVAARRPARSVGMGVALLAMAAIIAGVGIYTAIRSHNKTT